MCDAQKVLYHLTDESCIDSILQQGLLVQKGANCNAVNEELNAVFLCGEKDFEYWSIILNKHVLLKVSGIDFSAAEYYRYDGYGEYIWPFNIAPEYIEVCSRDFRASPKAMTKLCKSYLYSLSAFCLACAQYYNEIAYSEEELRARGNSLVAVLPNLSYSQADMSEF